MQRQNAHDALYWLGLVMLIAGCGSDMPFDVVPVHGKVTYEDGSLIEAGSVLITLNPVDVETKGKMTAPGAQTYIRMEDGTFDSVSSRRQGDGVVRGRHKVVVVSFVPDADGRPRPTNAVPRRYHKASTTPLEIEVERAKQYLEIKIPKK